ncbi:hypothetical protein GWC77_27320 [Paraburkholderia sp. NMBU_R16]|uniref:hypothetical protein n=1 Tax=Paraburkholderia sp. NMBU_R16 TaxID=2698676 RepID=UPI0015645F11|nr:hypothetical protein [Paraburkholderia sp. NMBU_R16]NRO99573.1 hypothetical protein [Paraburkholderia sp. NMBU_R16]
MLRILRRSFRHLGKGDVTGLENIDEYVTVVHESSRGISMLSRLSIALRTLRNTLHETTRAPRTPGAARQTSVNPLLDVLPKLGLDPVTVFSRRPAAGPDLQSFFTQSRIERPPRLGAGVARHTAAQTPRDARSDVPARMKQHQPDSWPAGAARPSSAFHTVGLWPPPWQSALLRRSPPNLIEFRPPTSIEEESKQLQMAIEQSRTEFFLRSLPSIGENFDVAAAADRGEIDAWEDLEPDIKALYASEREFTDEVVMRMGKPRHIERALKLAGMRSVANDGTTYINKQNGEKEAKTNNCLLIALMQHATVDYGSVLSEFVNNTVNQYRNILASLSFTDAEKVTENQKISAESHAARVLVDLINDDPSVYPKLSVEIIAEHDGVVYRHRIGSSDRDARTVVVVDRAGHFEAVTGAA